MIYGYSQLSALTDTRKRAVLLTNLSVQSAYCILIKCESYSHCFDWSNIFLVCFVFSFLRSSGVVRNYQVKLIRDFLSLGVVQKQMRSPMNGFVLHVNNNLENQFSTKKGSLDCGHVNIAWLLSKRDMQLLHYFITKKLHGPVLIKESFICKHCKLQHKKNLINRSFSFYLGAQIS